MLILLRSLGGPLRGHRGSADGVPPSETVASRQARLRSLTDTRTASWSADGVSSATYGGARIMASTALGDMQADEFREQGHRLVGSLAIYFVKSCGNPFPRRGRSAGILAGLRA